MRSSILVSASWETQSATPTPRQTHTVMLVKRGPVANEDDCARFPKEKGNHQPRNYLHMSLVRIHRNPILEQTGIDYIPWLSATPGMYSHRAHYIRNPGTGRPGQSKRFRHDRGLSGMIVSHFSTTSDPITHFFREGKTSIRFLAMVVSFQQLKTVLSPSSVNLTNQLHQSLNSNLLLKPEQPCA